MHLSDKPCERLPTKTIDSLNESTFLYMRYVLGQVSQITFEKDLDLVEMAVMEQLGNVLEDGKRILLGP